MKKCLLLPVVFTMLLSIFFTQTQAQRPESVYARRAAAGLSKPAQQPAASPAVHNRQTQRTVLAQSCPTCQQIPFTSFSPDQSFTSVYIVDSIWTNTFKYLYQDPSWPGGLLNFSAGCVNFTHYADTSYPDMPYWDGFTISKTNVVPFPCDTACSDPCNGLESQFSSITGGGVSGSNDPYAVAYYGYNAGFFPVNHTTLTLNSPSAICGLYVTNNAYAYKSMKCGDGFARKFTYKDSLVLTIKGFSGGVPTGSVNYYLADFRNPSAAYIVDAWKWVNLTALGTVDSVAFYLTTSDAGIYGPNTPMYFCIDDVKIGTDPSCGTCAVTDTTHNWFPTGNNKLKTAAAATALPLNITPNPAYSQISVQAKAGSQLEIFDVSGNKKHSRRLASDVETINVAAYGAGIYTVRIRYEGVTRSSQFIKK